MLNDYGKLIVLIVALVGGFGLAIAGLVVGDSSIYTPAFSVVATVIGYVTGNGVLARTGQAPSPIVVPSDPKVRRRLAQVVSDELDAEQAEADRIAAEEGLS